MISEQWRKECAQKVGLRGEPDDLCQLRADFAAHMELGKAWLAEHDRVAKTFYARLERLIIKNGWRTEA